MTKNTTPTPKYKVVCKACQSEDIVFDANLKWSVPEQAFVCQETQPGGPFGYCRECHDENYYEEIEINE